MTTTGRRQRAPHNETQEAGNAAGLSKHTRTPSTRMAVTRAAKGVQQRARRGRGCSASPLYQGSGNTPPLLHLSSATPAMIAPPCLVRLRAALRATMQPQPQATGPHFNGAPEHREGMSTSTRPSTRPRLYTQAHCSRRPLPLFQATGAACTRKPQTHVSPSPRRTHFIAHRHSAATASLPAAYVSYVSYVSL